MSHPVAVPRSLPPKFPDRCVLCGAASPGKRARFHAGSGYGAFFFLAWFESGKKSVQAPACGSCVVSAQIRGLMRFFVSALCAGLAAWFLFGVLGWRGGRGLGKLKALGVFFAAVIPAVVWDWLFPAHFSVTFDDASQTAVCHFADPAYALEFDVLNHPDVPEKLELHGNLQLDAKPPPQPLELPANFNPAESSRSTSGDFSTGESYEDKTNPFRNLQDPRFKK